MSETELADKLRAAILASGKSLSAIAAESGTTHGQLSRFMKGERSLTLDTAGKVFHYLGLKVDTGVEPEPPPAPKGKGKGRGKK